MLISAPYALPNISMDGEYLQIVQGYVYVNVDDDEGYCH
jgi:hypothetical protein